MKLNIIEFLSRIQYNISDKGDTMQYNTTNNMPMGRSEFRGGIIDYLGRKIVGTLITIFTLGIMYPWQ